jgi:hypothetical protein
MTAPLCRAGRGSREWCRAGRIIGLVLALLATGLPFDHSHPVHDSSVYDAQCPDARLAMGAPGAPLPDRSDGAAALVQRLVDVRPLRAAPPFRPLPPPAWRAPPA